MQNDSTRPNVWLNSSASAIYRKANIWAVMNVVYRPHTKGTAASPSSITMPTTEPAWRVIPKLRISSPKDSVGPDHQQRQQRDQRDDFRFGGSDERRGNAADNAEADRDDHRSHQVLGAADHHDDEAGAQDGEPHLEMRA